MKRKFILSISLVAALQLFAGTQVFSQSLSLSYTTPQNYTVGNAIGTLSPTVTGGPAAGGGQTTAIFAGDGYPGSADGNGISASFYNPLNTAVDAAGNIYVADAGNHLIRKITPLGDVSTLAGAGYAGYNDGIGTAALFQHPSALVVDAAGNVFVSDQQNHRIRKISPAGVVTTFAGSGSAGSADGTGTGASFNLPIGLTFDASGNLYVADYLNHKIRKITSAGVVSTYAGTGSAGMTNSTALSSTFRNPMGLAFDASGNLYVADRLNHSIRKITTGGTVSTFAGTGSSGSANGTGTGASFYQPNNLVVDGSGNIYVADQTNNMIRKITSGAVVTTFAGTTSAGFVDGTGAGVRFNSPYGLSIDKHGSIYVAENAGNQVRKIITTAFTLTPYLPDGLSFNTSTGAISGTPTAAAAATDYYVQAFNTTHSSSVFTLNITVSAAAAGINGSSNQNYILTYTPLKDTYTTDVGVAAASTDKLEVQTSIQYFDGLGRAMQTVQAWAGAAGTKDLVVPVEYDDLGRLKASYLPYVSSSADGSFKSSGLSEAVTYYSGTHTGVVQTAYPFSRPVYEPSPLNRLAEQGAPGAVWQPYSGSISGSGHTQKMEYKINAAGDTVKLWTISGTTVSTAGSYAAGELTRTLSKDENWSSGNAGSVDEYKDMEGRVVCKRVWETATVARSTYYVYDDFGRLRYVIPPKVTVSSLTEGSTTEFDQLVYAYHYDALGRLIEKKIPGKGWEEMVYDKLDRLVLSRDAVQAGLSKWLFSKYDELGRVIVTGLIGSSSSRASWQSSFDGASTHCESRDNANSSGTGTGYTNVALPAHSLVDYYYTLNYYDDYAFYGNNFGGTTGGQSTAVKGLATGSKVNILGSGSMLLTTSYYDGKGQVVQNKAENHLSGTDVTDLTYNFTGQVLSSTRSHTVGGVTTMVYLTYEYDHMGRKTKTYQKIGDAGSTQVLLSELVYNEVGQLKDKQLSNGGNTNSYTYNERGWLRTSGATGFNMELKYDNGSTPQYNGNIANQLWSSNGGGTNTFTYSYDALNRLTAGTTGSVYENSISYDPMGNIMSLTRNGTGAQNYSYSGNRLNSVSGGVSRTYSSYDANGNLGSDGTNGFTYNVLNLPATVTGANAATYTYDATGRKLSRVAGGVTTHYVNGIQYTGSTIDFIQTEEGLARRNTATSYLYQYNLTDHLGNSRVTFNSGGSILQIDDYYPFGMTFNSFVSGTRNNYLYNGKELQDGLNQYDYGARFYDPEIGRWNVVDPMAFKYFAISPYNYALNNPMRFIDPDGRDIIGVTESDAKKALEDILSMFKGEKFAGFRKLLSLDKKGKTFNKIGADALSQALKGGDLNADEQALVDLVSNTINSNDKHIVEFARDGDNVSRTGEGFLSKALPKQLVEPVIAANGGLPTRIISAFGGSGVTTATEKGTYSLIIEGLDISKSGTDYLNNKTGTYGNNPVGRSLTTGHEIFGHGRPVALGRAGSQHQDAIRTENLILRVMGQGAVQRDGSGHGPGTKVTNPSSLPDFK